MNVNTDQPTHQQAADQQAAQHQPCFAHKVGHGPPHELSVRQLHVHYGPICALENADFTAHCGTRIGIYGPNGAGKSSLLKALAGLLPHAQGEVLWNGKPITQSRQEIAYLPQREEADFNFPITVRGVVEMGRFPALGWFGRFRKSDRDAVDAAIASMELGDLERRQIRQLSGGQQQRVFLARAIAQQAHVLLLDEPFTGLDLPSRRQLGSLLQRLAKEGRLILLTHHGLNDGEELFDQVMFLRRRIIAMGPPGELLNDTELRTKAGLPT